MFPKNSRKVRRHMHAEAWRARNREQEEYFNKTIRKIPVEAEPTLSKPGWRARNREQEEDFNKTTRKILVETEPTVSKPGWRARNCGLEENINKKTRKIAVETETIVSKPDWRTHNRGHEEDVKQTTRDIPVETEVTTSTPGWRALNRGQEDDFKKITRKTPVETQPTVSKPDSRVRSRGHEEDFKKTTGNIPVETQSTISTPGRRSLNRGQEEDFNKTTRKIPAETQPTVSTPGWRATNRGQEEGFKKTTRKIPVEPHSTISTPGEHKLAQNLRELLYSGEDADCILRVQGRNFRAHRAILVARSTVFAAMFKHDRKERDRGVVVIEDCNSDVFESFLEHLYTGSVEFSEDTVIRLYTIADKYDSPDLKVKCVDFMSRRMSVETFCDVVKLSLEYNKSELLKKATDFFVKNFRKITISSEWQTFQEEHRSEANKIHLQALDYYGICE